MYRGKDIQDYRRTEIYRTEKDANIFIDLMGDLGYTPSLDKTTTLDYGIVRKIRYDHCVDLLVMADLLENNYCRLCEVFRSPVSSYAELTRTYKGYYTNPYGDYIGYTLAVYRDAMNMFVREAYGTEYVEPGLAVLWGGSGHLRTSRGLDRSNTPYIFDKQSYYPYIVDGKHVISGYHYVYQFGGTNGRG